MTDEALMEQAFTAPLAKAAARPRYTIQPVPSQHVAAIWPCVRDLVEQAALDSSGVDTRTLDDVLTELVMSDAQLWLVVQNGPDDAVDVAGICITRVITYPRRTLVGASIAGRSFMGWRQQLEDVVGAWGRQIGASELLLHTDHPELVRLFRRRGWAERGVIMTKGLRHGG